MSGLAAQVRALLDQLRKSLRLPWRNSDEYALRMQRSGPAAAAVLAVACTLLFAPADANAEFAYPYGNGLETADEQSLWQLSGLWSIAQDTGDRSSHSGSYHLDNNPDALDQEYQSSEQNAVLSDFIPIPAGAIRPVLSYSYRLALFDCDRMYVEAITPTLTEWTVLKSYQTRDNHDSYTNETIDLSDFKGQSVQVRFRQYTCTTTGARLWLIDDLHFEEDPVPPEYGYPYSNGFESTEEQTAWNLQGSWAMSTSQGERVSYSGDYHLDNNPSSVDQQFYRDGSQNATLNGQVSVPADAIRPVLRYGYNLDLLDGDSMYVEVRASDSSEWETIRTYQFADNHPGYTHDGVDLSAYKGKSIQLRFEQSAGSNTGPRTWLIDDLFIGEDPVPADVGYPYSNGFESAEEQAAWNLQGSWSVLDSQGERISYNGAYHLDNNPSSVDQRFYHGGIQSAILNGQITIPASAVRPVLSYWYNLNLLDGDTTCPMIRTSDSSEWTCLTTYKPHHNHPEYTRETLDLTAYKGQSIQLRFEQWNNSTYGSRTWLIDDLYVGEDPAPPEYGYPYSNGFESTEEQTAWNLQGSWAMPTSQGERVSYSGSYHLDNNPDSLDQRLFRTGQNATLNGQITIPADAVRPLLSYRYNLNLLNGDRMYVQVRTPGSSEWVSIRDYRSWDNHPGYVREGINLSDYKGQSIQLRFEQAASSNNGPRTWLIDELSIGEDPVPPEYGYPYSNGFESAEEQAAWNLQGSWAMPTSQGERLSYSGSRHLDNNPDSLDQRLFRTGQNATLNGQITIPADAVRPLLSYRYNLNLLGGDHMYVQVRTPGSSEWVSIRDYQSRDNHPGYVREGINLSDYKGQSIQLRFEQVASSNSGPRTWLIDELSIGEDPVPPEYGYPYSNGFESAEEQAAWNLQGSWAIPTSQGERVSYSGSHHLDNNPDSLDQYIYQIGQNATLNGRISVPGDAIDPVISYWYRLQLLTADYMYVLVRTPEQSNWTKLRIFRPSDNNTTYLREDLDLSAYKGQSIELRFEQWTGSDTGPRVWLIDDLRVGVSSNYDQDGDGTPDIDDPDRDGDSVDNGVDLFPDNPAEWSDLDADGVGDNADPDRDGDGVLNAEDIFPNDPAESSDLDQDGIGDNADSDRDGDGLSNADEEQTYLTDPLKADTDGDGLSDGEEVLTHHSNPLMADTDGDGLDDREEVANLHTDPTKADSDGDGLSDAQEVLTYLTDPINADSDSDGLSDGDEIAHGTNPHLSDSDSDGFFDALEIAAGTDPLNADSIPPDLDTDGIPDILDDDRDGDGVANAEDAFPNDPAESSDLDGNGIGDNADPDRDGDGFSNDEELAAGTDPNNAQDFPDRIKPQLLLDGVSERTTTADTIDLSGSVSDENSGLASLTAVSDRYPGVTLAVTVANGHWSLSVPLETGMNAITLTAVDQAGNPAYLSVNVERTGGDSSLSLVIQQPLAGSVLSEPSLVIRGILRSEQPAQSLSVSVDGVAASLTATELNTEFLFVSEPIELSEGLNSFQVRGQADDRSVTSGITVTYRPEATLPDEPVIRILSPSTGSYLSESGFTLVGEVHAPGGLAALTLDGTAISFVDLQSGYYSFSEPIGFAVDAADLSMILQARDSLEQSGQLTIDFYRDQTQPTLVLENALSASPVVNGVTQQPYRLRGRVSDDNLSGFSINGTPVALSPGEQAGDYWFDVALKLTSGEPLSVLLSARDQADNRTELEYILRLDASLDVSMLLPVAGTELIHGDTPISLQVAIEVSGSGAADALAEAVLSDSTGAEVASATLSGSGIRSGQLQVPAVADRYEIGIVLSDQGTVVAETSRTLLVRDPVEVPLALERTEPANGEVGVEPNGFIGLYFNQPIDIDRVSVSLHETAQGFTYEDLDTPGTASLNAKGYQLVEVNRSFEAVPGNLSLLPGNRIVAFYPERELAYDSELYLDVNYDGEELAHLMFHTRALPTFINGTVIDQFSLPVEGVVVSLPALGRTTRTNRDGAFAFGYGDRYDEAIPGGRYELVVNPGLKETRFGSVRRWINLQSGRRNRLDVTRLTLLDQKTPFTSVEGRGNLSLLGGAVKLDLSAADLLFPDSRRGGDLHLQFAEYGQYPYPIGGRHLPHWIYNAQPAGIRVEGEMRVDLALPQLNRSYDYLPADGNYVLMMGFDEASRHIVPVGVGRIENYRVVSAGVSHYQSLDVIGYVLQSAAAQPKLQAYADGEIDLQALLSALDGLAE